MPQPLVTVICLCYNHEPYIEECVTSVFNQTYKKLQVIVVDDASSDGSKAVIKKLISRFPQIEFVDLPQNLGNCAAFNRGYALAKGDYIVDLATDDIFLPDRIERQIDLFDQLGPGYGVVHTDAVIIDEKGNELYTHTKYLKKHGLITQMPEGDIYEKVLYKYFISPASMLVKREVLDQLGGYDEKLAYEDFDFWIRSSRNWKYAFLPKVLTKVRRLSTSHSSGWYKKGDKQLYSTYLICKKVEQLNRSEQENIALMKRLKYELRQSVFSENNREARLFYKMLKAQSGNTLIDNLLINLSKLNLPLAFIRRAYNKLRFGR